MDYEHITQVMSIVSLFPLWFTMRLWIKQSDSDKESERFASLAMMFPLVLVMVVLLQPLVSAVIELSDGFGTREVRIVEVEK